MYMFEITSILTKSDSFQNIKTCKMSSYRVQRQVLKKPKCSIRKSHEKYKMNPEFLW